MAYIGYGYGYGRAKKAGAGFDPVAVAYFAAVPNAFDAARKTIINDLIAGLRNDGNLTKIDRLWLFANSTTSNAVIDLIGLNSATLVNAPAFVADQGYTSNGSTSYINSNYNASTQGINYIANSATLGIYSRTSSSSTYIDIGVSIGANITDLLINYNSTLYSRINGGDTSVSAPVSTGFFTGKIGSGTARAYKNGLQIASTADTGTFLNNANIYICARNSDGTASGFSNRQYSIGLIGGGDLDQAALYTRIQTYMTSLGTQV